MTSLKWILAYDISSLLHSFFTQSYINISIKLIYSCTHSFTVHTEKHADNSHLTALYCSYVMVDFTHIFRVISMTLGQSYASEEHW